jgi:hypothetical protein
MSSYFSIEYTGSSAGFNRFVAQKDWNIDIKHVNTGKVLVKAPQDIAEEILFFNGSDIDELNGKIERVNFIINLDKRNRLNRILQHC